MIGFLSIFLLSLSFAQAPQPAAPPATAPANPTAATSEGAAEDGKPPVSLFEEQGELLVKKLTQPFIYEREGRRDPFLLPEAKAAPLQPGALFGPFLELQEVKLEDIQVRGILLNPVSPKALLSVKDIKDVRKVGVGDYLGENFGVVQTIREGEIIIVQTFGEGDKKSTTTRTLTIRK